MKLVSKKTSENQSVVFSDIRSWYERNLHPDILDIDDAQVYKHVYHEGRWAYIFQVTQRGAQRFFERAKPDNVIDIASLTSIYRPGPLAAKVDDIYVEAKKHPENVEYGHPLVKKCLESTFGAIIFQETLMQLGNVVGNLTLEECDKLRKVITKRSASGASKAKEEALKLEKKFIEGAVANGLDKKQAEDLFEKISFFSGYGFCRSLADTEVIKKYTKLGEFVELTTIDNVNRGDFLKSRDEAIGSDIYVEVIARHDHGVIELFEFQLDDGSSVRCSMEHKFRVKDGRMLPMRQIVEENLDIVAQDAEKV
jgi:DNA polymerase-3 subunit alpha